MYHNIFTARKPFLRDNNLQLNQRAARPPSALRDTQISADSFSLATSQVVGEPLPAPLHCFHTSERDALFVSKYSSWHAALRRYWLHARVWKTSQFDPRHLANADPEQRVCRGGEMEWVREEGQAGEL